MHELREFSSFIIRYFRSHILNFGQNFENLKDLIVAFLIVKRGKYSSSFLNTSFLILVLTTFVAGPIIVENNPFITELSSAPSNNQTAILSYNPYENSLSTIISVKPRDRIIDYTVVENDTLASIGKKFDVSVDTIKWANDLKTDTIKPGDVLKIPPVTGVVHKVIAGENIYTIAKKYKTDAQAIVNFPFNDFTDMDNFGLKAGQTLYVPNGVIEEEQQRYFAMNPTYAQVNAGVRGSSNFIWPTTGLITQYPIWYHMALDIAANNAPPIIAADTGTVIYAGCINWGYGCHVIIDHGNGFQTLYGHMSYIAVSAGQTISQGQTVGTMGSTGRSTGMHCHFEIRLGGVLQNPLNYLK
jgi:murein DD-endopeptidase MepM/ murein hydrolase activator NlpD